MLTKRFFKQEDYAVGESLEVGPFIATCFSLKSIVFPESLAEEDVGSGMEDEPSKKGVIRVKHNIPDVEVQRTIVDFGRYFCSGSLAGGSLRRSNSTVPCRNMSSALEIFASCTHNVYDDETEAICDECARRLLAVGSRYEESISSTALLCQALANASCWGSHVEICRVSRASASIKGKLS